MENQFYGLTDTGKIVLLPKAEYSSTALTLYNDGDGTELFDLILTEQQYRVILSHVDSELNDIDGDGLVPTYMVVSFITQLPIFPHASVDTPEELQKFIDSHSYRLSAGVKLTDVRDTWPRLEDEPVVEQSP